MKRPAFLAAAVAAVLLTGTAALLTGTAAWGAPPANDTYAGAAVISALPFETTFDLTGATTDALDDEMGAGCTSLPGIDASLWYRYTATSTGWLALDVSAPSYSPGVIVATGEPGSFNLVTCGGAWRAGRFGALWHATAGVSYVILVHAFDFDLGSGGSLRLTQQVAHLQRNNDFTGDGHADVAARDASGRLYVYPGNGAGGWKSRITYGPGWNSMTAVLAPGDWDGDGHADLMARDRYGYLYLYRGDGASHFAARLRIGSGWNAMTAIVGLGDFTGDGPADIAARDAFGRLYVYPGNGAGGWKRRITYGTGWNAMTALLGIGDFDGGTSGNLNVDLAARDERGTLWLYPGDGRGGFLARRLIGTGWAGFTGLLAPQDFSGDGDTDVLARSSAGYLYLYDGDGAAWWTLPATRVGSGWNGMTAITS
jgi:hypothetical protein